MTTERSLPVGAPFRPPGPLSAPGGTRHARAASGRARPQAADGGIEFRRGRCDSAGIPSVTAAVPSAAVPRVRNRPDREDLPPDRRPLLPPAAVIPERPCRSGYSGTRSGAAGRQFSPADREGLSPPRRSGPQASPDPPSFGATLQDDGNVRRRDSPQSAAEGIRPLRFRKEGGRRNAPSAQAGHDRPDMRRETVPACLPARPPDRGRRHPRGGAAGFADPTPACGQEEVRGEDPPESPDASRNGGRAAPSLEGAVRAPRKERLRWIPSGTPPARG